MNHISETIPASKAKTYFSQLLRRMKEQHESFAITQRGKVEGVLLGIEEYESLIETLEILSDRELVKSIEKGKPLSYEVGGLYSYRTSDYRIIYKIEEEQLIIIAITVG